MKGVIFDLDGTLLDSLEDIADSANYALTQLGYSPLPVDDYRYLAGGGNRRLMTNLLRHYTHADPNEQLLAKSIQYKMDYQTGPSGHAKTKPFPGTHDMLGALQAASVQLAILSNKTEDSVRAVVAEHFPTIRWAYVGGAREDTPLKPDPTAALNIVKRHMSGLKPGDCAFVGDTDVDMKTGAAAGMTPLGVPWGFRTAEQLRSNGAHLVVESAMEICTFIIDSEETTIKS